MLKQRFEGIYVQLYAAHPAAFFLCLSKNKNKFSRAQLLFCSFIYKNTAVYLAVSKPSPGCAVSQELVQNMYKIKGDVHLLQFLIHDTSKCLYV
jgi:hypothetical protein